MTSSNLEGIIKQFHYYKKLADQTFEQLNDQDIHFKPNAYSNNISIIVKHIVGNMLSRWTNFLTEDGEKEWRNRDAEFIDSYSSKEMMIQEWEKGWKCLFDALSNLSEKDLNSVIYIRNQGQTVTSAIHRQLAHYPYHVGQIVYLGTVIKGTNWESLSIPKGHSNNFNKEKFEKGKHLGHFTDDLR